MLREESTPPHWSILGPLLAYHPEECKYGKAWLAYTYAPIKFKRGLMSCAGYDYLNRDVVPCAHCIRAAGSENIDFIESNIEKALETKMKKMSKYESFKRMELFIYIQLLEIGDSNWASSDDLHVIPLCLHKASVSPYNQ